MIGDQTAASGAIVGEARDRDAVALRRRLDALRAGRAAPSGPGWPGEAGRVGRAPAVQRTGAAARALAEAVGGTAVETPLGTYVRVDRPGSVVDVDRAALALLPGQPPAGAPLLCLDTETTGLATAAGTFVFLVGLGRWRGGRFEQVQLLLPDQSEEPAFLAALRRLIPDDAWLVTYNGRSFDWPLLVTRFRMARGAPPRHAGHLDLLPFVRRIFRHRLPDARLRTVERELLDLRRHGDVEGWEIPGRYLAFLREGRAAGLVDVVRHNDEDVRSLGRLLGHVAERLGDPTARSAADRGDLAALGRAFGRERRHAEALACLEAALGAGRPPSGQRPPSAEERRRRGLLEAERARTLRRLGRTDEALEAWSAIARAGGPLAGVAWVELAKIHEHRRRDDAAALEAALAALGVAERGRWLGRPLPLLEADARHRTRRLRRRLARRRSGAPSTSVDRAPVS